MKPEDHLSFDIAMGLKKAKVGNFEDCQRISKRVLEQLQLTGWKFEKREPPPAH